MRSRRWLQLCSVASAVRMLMLQVQVQQLATLQLLQLLQLLLLPQKLKPLLDSVALLGRAYSYLSRIWKRQ